MTFPMPFSVQKALLFSFLHPQVRFERSAVQQKVIQLPLLFGSLLCFDFIKVNWLFLTRTTRRLSFFSFGFRFLICLINSVCKICLINSANMSWTPSRFKPFKGNTLLVQKSGLRLSWPLSVSHQCGGQSTCCFSPCWKANTFENGNVPLCGKYTCFIWAIVMAAGFPLTTAPQHPTTAFYSPNGPLIINIYLR